MPLANQRHLFEIPDGIAFFNCANAAPQLRSVRKAGERALARNARPWEIASSDWFTDVELAAWGNRDAELSGEPGRVG